MSEFALARARELAAAHLDRIRKTTDRLFLWLTCVQFVAAVLVAVILSPRTYIGSESFVNPHVTIALVLGALVSVPVVVAVLLWPGQYKTRVIVSVCQMLMSALLIHLTGGRIETHFHVFGSLAFLAFYRDWRILIWASLVVAGDHLVRGIYLPESVYGVFANAEWRFVEHAVWVLFEDVILIASCNRGIAEVKAIAAQRAEQEETNEHIEAMVQERTEDLKESELQKTTVFENALDGIVTANAHGEITEINPAAERIFGVCRHEVMGRPLSSIFHPGHSQEFISESLKAHASRGRGHLVHKNAEVLAVSEKGTPIPVEVSMMCVPVKGSPLYTAFARDITERKKLEEKLAHANKMESLGQLATGVAHEINTPNQYIGDNVRFVEESFGSMADLIRAYRTALEGVQLSPEHEAKIRELERQADLEFALEQIPPALGQALEGVERVGSIIRAMKEFAHPGMESYTMVDLNRVVESTVMVARNEWKYVAEVNLDLDPDLPSIQANQGELSQVVLNLVVNAAQAIEERFKGDGKGSILISTRADERFVTLTVTDDGGGIPDEIKANIFDPFFTTKGVGVGTGQGLTITRSVIERHSGEIELNSKAGVGTTFTIRLPIGLAEAKAS
jgi:PAS domain S-box-containing protein